MIWGRGKQQKTTHQNNKKKKRLKKNEDSLRDLWDSIKHKNIHIIGVTEGEEGGGLKLYLKKS